MAFGLHYSIGALGGMLGAQWERERRETLFLMAPVALSVLPHLPHLPWWVGAAFFVLFFWRLALVLSGRWLPRASVRWVAAIACTAAVFAHYQTVFGREPGVAMLVLFLGLKLMEMRARRDLFVVIFLCFFLLLTAFFHSQSIATAGVVLLALYGLLVAMLTMQFRQHETRIRQRFRSIGLMLLQAMPIAAAVFLLFPRFGGPLWGLPSDAQRARTGLSESMTPGNIAQLSESDTIAFRVLFEGDAPPNATLYWRGPVFGSFDGLAWRAAERQGALAPRVEFPGGAKPVRYTMTLEPTGRNWLFALEMPSRAQSGVVEPLLRPDLQLVARAPVFERVRLSLVAHTEFRAGLDETATSLQSWLGLPAGFNPRTVAMAARWRAEEGETPGTDARLVERAFAMFRAEPFRYTLEPPLLGRDSVDDFLFVTRAGFCEHYASAFAVLMRALGIPARIVTGYQGGERNPVDGYWVVRQADAHAWTEVWLDGRGWVRVDPTAAVSPQRIEHGLRLGLSRVAAGESGSPLSMLGRLRFNFDALGNAWNQWILSYDQGRQRSLLGRLGIAAGDWRQLAAALAAVLAALIGGVALLTLRPHRPRDPVVQAYESFCARLATTGLERAAHETPSRYLARIARALDAARLAEARRIVAAYERLRYADAAPERAAVRHLRKSVQAFKP